MKFTKMQGCGNDYIYVNGFTQSVRQEEKPELVRRLSDRHYGIGGDGVIFINPAEAADFEMEMYNADGSRSEMCGNGIRCVAKYVYDKGMTNRTAFTIASVGRTMGVELFLKDGEAERIRVDMGRPEFDAGRIPVIVDKTPVVGEPIDVNGAVYRMTCVSMGNPHAVVFTEEVDRFPVEQIGPLFENHARFPNRVNTEFVKVVDRQNIRMRVWERGTGETLACGTGCCASAVACILNGYTDHLVTVHALGGEITVEWNGTDGPVYMTGPAVTVFEGQIDSGKR